MENINSVSKKKRKHSKFPGLSVFENATSGILYVYANGIAAEMRMNKVIFLFCVSRRIRLAETYRKRLSPIFRYLSEIRKRLFSPCDKKTVEAQKAETVLFAVSK